MGERESGGRKTAENFNEDLKKEFNKQSNKSYLAANKALFGKIHQKEKELGRDVYTFSLTEIEELFLSFNVSGYSNDFNVLKRYLIFCLEKGLINTFVLEGINTKHFDDLNLKDRLRFNEDTLIEYIEGLYNPQDKLILRLLFEGVNGKDCSELRNLKKSDINWNNNELTLYGEGEKKGKLRKIEVSDECIRLIKLVINENIYYSNNGLAEKKEILVVNDYIIRQSFRKNSNHNERVNKGFLYNRFNRYKEWLNEPRLTQTSVYQSGMINYTIKLSKKYRKHYKDFHHKEEWSEVAEVYPMKTFDVKGSPQYNALFRLIKEEEIAELYGNYMNDTFELQPDDDLDKEILEKKKRDSSQHFRKMILNVYNNRCDK